MIEIEVGKILSGCPVETGQGPDRDNDSGMNSGQRKNLDKLG